MARTLSLTLALAGLIALTSAVTWAEDEAPSELDSLYKELEQVRSEIDKAKEQVSDRTKALWRRQHDLEYKDPVCIQLRTEIKQLEKEMVGLRKELDARLSSLAEWREIEKQRKEMYQRLRGLRDQEQLILNEITAAENKAAMGE